MVWDECNSLNGDGSGSQTRGEGAQTGTTENLVYSARCQPLPTATMPFGESLSKRPSTTLTPSTAAVTVLPLNTSESATHSPAASRPAVVLPSLPRAIIRRSSRCGDASPPVCFGRDACHDG